MVDFHRTYPIFMSKRSWQLLEKHLQTIAKRCGFHYLPASTGDSQGGGDGGGTLKIQKYDFYWKFESKHRIKTFNKPVQIDELSDKILEIMSQDRASWPEVLCLFTPHHVLYEQMERKINSLEKNGRIPFKVVIWHYGYIVEILKFILQVKDFDKVYPGHMVTASSDPGLVLAKFIADIENKTREGFLIKNSYIHSEDYSFLVLEMSIKKIVKQSSDGRTEPYEILFMDKKFYTSTEKINNLALTKVPVGKASSVVANQSTVGVPETIIEEIDVVDWEQRYKEIENKEKKIVALFKSLQNEDETGSLYDSIKGCADSKRVVIKVINSDFLPNLVPFIYLTEQDFETRNQLSFVVIGGLTL